MIELLGGSKELTHAAVLEASAHCNDISTAFGSVVNQTYLNSYLDSQFPLRRSISSLGHFEVAVWICSHASAPSVQA